jgi:biopolymer transport protein ExbD
MARRIGQKGTSSFEEPTVNLTPLIDVVFVILIMFILVAPLLELDRVELADSPASRQGGSSASEASPVAIHVHKDNTIWMDNHKLKPEQLTAMLIQSKKRYPQARLQVFHDKKAEFGVYQSVKNAAEAAGYRELDIVLKPS